jgi:3-oxoacyl-ACP reductase-like protein
MCREREAAAAAAQHTLLQQLARDPPHAYSAHVAHVTVTLDALLQSVQAACNRQSAAVAVRSGSSGTRSLAAAGGAADVSWVLGAMLKLKELLLESDR